MSQSNPSTNMASMVESAINKEQKEKLAAILKHISKLSDLEKLYLYLKLPTGQTVEEPIKRGCSSTPATSNRTMTTLKWIKSHYVEDNNVSVPKQEVYNQYRLYCEAANIIPVGSADFGKMVKTAFPNIHHRRLGQRGKSKYCYGGLTRKTQIEIPTLPLLQTKPTENTMPAPNPFQEMQNLSSQLVCEWACRLLDKKFTDLKSVAQHLIQTGASYGKKAALFSMMYDNKGNSSHLQEKRLSDPKLQDTQALLQRKLHQKEVLKGHLNLLKQLKKNQQEVKSSPVSSMESLVGCHDTKCLPKCLGNVVSCQSEMGSKLVIHNQFLSSNLIENSEKNDDLPAKSNVLSHKLSASEVQSSQGNFACSNLKMSTSYHDKYIVRGFDIEKCKSGQGVIESPREASISMSISSDSLLSKQSPELFQEKEDQKQQKRSGEVLNGSCHHRVSKRRRCMTSLGVSYQESSEDVDIKSHVNFPDANSRFRPFSCPILHDSLSINLGSKDRDTFVMRKKQCSNSSKERVKHKRKDKHMILNNEEISQKKASHSSHSCKSECKEIEQNTKADKNSFHFVQKPTVIAVRQPGRIFPSVMSCPNFSNPESEKISQESLSDIKKTHNILNSLLSTDSDSDSHPNPILSTQTSTSSSLSLSTLQLHDLDNCNNEQGHNLPHTLDNAYILSSQSNRSAFVPVASNKLQDYSRSRSSHPCLNMYSPSTERQNTETKPPSQSEQFEDYVKFDSLIPLSQRVSTSHLPQGNHTSPVLDNLGSQKVHIPAITSDSYSVTKDPLVDGTVSDCFRPITYNKTLTEIPVSHQSLVTSTSVVSSSPISQTKMSSNISLSNTAFTSKQSIKARTKSPVTPPRRQSRSRFTPIRPKISGSTPSPQKKDMRPVSTILKEQRVRNAQELLVNIANTYQGEIKLQMPAELLVLSPPGISKTSDVLVTIGAPGNVSTSRPTSSALSSNVTNDLAVVDDSQSVSLCRCPSINAEVAALHLRSNEDRFQNIISSPTGGTTPMNRTSEHAVGNASNANSQEMLFQGICGDAQVANENSQNKNFVIEDNNGTIYTMDEGNQIFPFSQNVQNLFKTQMLKTSKAKSNYAEAPNVINIKDINGQVVGPDDTGQTFLLIPSSVSVLESQNEANASHSSNETASLLPLVVKEVGKSMQTLPLLNRVSSSSALLSELSQIASASKQENLQTPIQHDSAVSAFHKCAPNKPQSAIASVLPGSRLLFEGDASNMRLHVKSPLHFPTEQSSIKEADSLNLISNSENRLNQTDVSQGHLIRKRKASKSREDGVKDKKRQNTSERNDKLSEDDDVLIVDVERKHSGHERNLGILDSLRHEKSPNLQNKPVIDFSDTESLLEMIGGSRSLTVKQTVMAMNSLRAEMRKKLESSSHCMSDGNNESELNTSDTLKFETVFKTSKQISGKEGSQEYVPNPTKGKHDESVTLHPTVLAKNGHNDQGERRRSDDYSIKEEGRPTHKICHPNKKSMCLNLESLESDALLDSELTLDHHLVCEVGEGKAGKPDNKMSVAVAAKSSHRSRVRKQKENETKMLSSKSSSPITADNPSLTLRLGNGAKKSSESKREKQFESPCEREEESHTQPTLSKGNKRVDKICVTSASTVTLPRRSVSCVRDILQRRTSAFLGPLKQDNLSNVEKSYGAEYFDALLSKLQSKSNETITSASGTKSQPKIGADLDIPLDVVDFVTESMSSQSMYNYPSARCISVPNTKPDYFSINESFNVAHSKRLLSADSSDISMSACESNTFYTEQKQTDPLSDKVDEHILRSKQNVFLSPVGPAKLARRQSIEKSLAQPLTERSIMKTHVELSSSRYSSEASSLKSASGLKAQSTDRASTRTPVDRLMNYGERKRAKTPFDPAMVSQLIEKKNEKQRQVSVSPEEFLHSKPVVNRSLTQTPSDKFFQKIVSDSVFSKFQVENLSQPCLRDQPSNQDDTAFSQTPTSDAGYGSVSETPVSDFGYNSISPSPVMMSSSSFFGECGRRDITSPATIFMPLRSDSALSLNNNVISDHHICPSQTNLSEILPSVSNQYGDGGFDAFEQNEKSNPESLMLIQTMNASSDTQPSKGNLISLQMSERDERQKNDPSNSDGMSEMIDLSKLVSPSHHSIPTPPFSPNSTLMSTAPSTLSPLPFNIPFSPVPNHDNSPSPPVPKFLLPCSTSSSSTPLFYHQSSVSPPRHSFPQEQLNPCVSHVLTPSPHILARPPSSPHHFGTHPSPPFTPSSQRSLPSPCPTPSSFKSLISPRCLTPSVDSSHVPNAFMPIQSSCLQTASLAPTHSYIQPIKPVVTLASPSCHVTGNKTLAHTSDSTTGTVSSLVESYQNSRGHFIPGSCSSVISDGKERLTTHDNVEEISHGNQMSVIKNQNALKKLNGKEENHMLPLSNVTTGQGKTTEVYTEVYGNKSSRDSVQMLSKLFFSSLEPCSSPPKMMEEEKNSRCIKSNNGQFAGMKDQMSSNNMVISQKETLHLSPSSTQILSQTNSPFSAVPSKLQVDLTKLETKQNPTSLVHSHHFPGSQCKINLDSSHNASSASLVEMKSLAQSSYSTLTSLSPRNQGSMGTSPNKGKLPNPSGERLVQSIPSSASGLFAKMMWTSNLPKPSCQDDLQATLEVLRDMDGQYFPCEDDSSNNGSASGT